MPVPRSLRWPVDPVVSARLALLAAPGVAQLAAARRKRLTPEQLAEVQLRAATPHPERVPEGMVTAAVAQFRRQAPQSADLHWPTLLSLVALLARGPALLHRAAAVDVPTMVLHGQDDPMVPLPSALAFAQRQPTWRVLTRPGVGHVPHLEDAEWVVVTPAFFVHASRKRGGRTGRDCPGFG